jgi:hypothetical protein
VQAQRQTKIVCYYLPPQTEMEAQHAQRRSSPISAVSGRVRYQA